MQLQFLPHTHINFTQWDEAITNSSNPLMYAQSIYLNHMCPQWAALVTTDYSFVMPLTFKKKYGIPYLYQPTFCQQLGVFGKHPITPTILHHFITEAKKHFKFAEINLNHQNQAQQAIGGIPRKNYILPLSPTYDAIKNNYSSELIKKNLQRSLKFNLQYKQTHDVKTAIASYQQLYPNLAATIPQKEYDSLTTACQQLMQLGMAFGRQVTMPNGEILAAAIFLKDRHRIYNIASCTHPNGRTLEANHFLFDQLIQEFANTPLILDFEGSDIPGIERFYQKFGAINQPYFFTKWNHLPWPIRHLKK